MLPSLTAAIAAVGREMLLEHPTLVAARVGLSNGASDCMHHTHFTHSKAVLALLL